MNNKMSKMVYISLLLCLFNGAWAEGSKEVKSPTINCTLTDEVAGDNALAAKDTFKPTTEMLYYVCISNDVKKGQRVKASWIAVDTNKVAPDNYKIGEKTLDVTDVVGENQEWTVKYSLSKPTAGWPAGKYRVDLFLDEQPLQSKDFSVK